MAHGKDPASDADRLPSGALIMRQPIWLWLPLGCLVAPWLGTIAALLTGKALYDLAAGGFSEERTITLSERASEYISFAGVGLWLAPAGMLAAVTVGIGWFYSKRAQPRSSRWAIAGECAIAAFLFAFAWFVLGGLWVTLTGDRNTLLSIGFYGAFLTVPWAIVAGYLSGFPFSWIVFARAFASKPAHGL